MISVFDARPALISTRVLFGVTVGATLLGAMAVASIYGRRFGRTPRATTTPGTPSTRHPDARAPLARDSGEIHRDWPDSGALIVIVEDDSIFQEEDFEEGRLAFLDEAADFAEEDERAR